jgi:hypothetical protein
MTITRLSISRTSSSRAKVSTRSTFAARINAPVAEACKDLTFLKLFYNWERTHIFQLKLIDNIESTVAEHARALNLADYAPDAD